jgi:hypothetical protein
MPRNSNGERMQKLRRAEQEERVFQDELNKPKVTAAECKRGQRDSNRVAAHESSMDSVAVERRDVSAQPSTSPQSMNPGAIQHRMGQDGHQVPVVSMETEQPLNTFATS